MNLRHLQQANIHINNINYSLHVLIAENGSLTTPVKYVISTQISSLGVAFHTFFKFPLCTLGVFLTAFSIKKYYFQTLAVTLFFLDTYIGAMNLNTKFILI